MSGAGLLKSPFPCTDPAGIALDPRNWPYMGGRPVARCAGLWRGPMARNLAVVGVN